MVLGFWWGGAWRLGSYWWPGYLWARPWWTGYYGYYGRGYVRSGYNSGGSYSVDYGYGDGGNGSAPYAAAATPVESTPPVSPEAQREAGDLYQRALRAFQEGDFRNALRWGAHAAVDNPEDAGLHVLLSLAMFAQGDFQGAAIEAHGLAANGKIPDWETVYGFYGKLEPYETQLRALETFVAENPSAAEGRFLLGFHYLMAGHRKAAQVEFLEALKAVPEDQLSAELLVHAGGKVPADILRRQSQSLPSPQGTPPARPPAPPQARPKQGPEPVPSPVPETQRLF
jgi:tetratricopeptide (TPR) repeat protein